MQASSSTLAVAAEDVVYLEDRVSLTVPLMHVLLGYHCHQHLLI